MAYLTNAKQEALRTLGELSSLLSIEKEDQQDTEFIHKPLKFIQSILSTLERIETVERESKWIRPQLHLILSTGRQVAQFVSLQMTFNVAFKVSQEIKSLFNHSVPENLERHYYKLKGLLAEATEKIKRGIQPSCDKIMDETIKACESNSCNFKTVRHLDANLLSGTSADIIDCEVIVNNAHEIIEKLQREAEEELLKRGYDFASTTAAEVWQAGLSVHAIYVIGRAAYRCVTSEREIGMSCLNIAKKLKDNTSDREKVNSKRNRYLEISNRLGSLERTQGDVNLIEVKSRSTQVDVNLIEVTNRSTQVDVNLIEVKSRRTCFKRGGCLFAGCTRKNEE